MTISGVAIPMYSDATRTAAALIVGADHDPIGCQEVGGPRSPLAGTRGWSDETSLRPSACSTTRAVEPTGTVDLLTTIVSGSRCGPISLARSFDVRETAEPSAP